MTERSMLIETAGTGPEKGRDRGTADGTSQGNERETGVVIGTAIGIETGNSVVTGTGTGTRGVTATEIPLGIAIDQRTEIGISEVDGSAACLHDETGAARDGIDRIVGVATQAAAAGVVVGRRLGHWRNLWTWGCIMGLEDMGYYLVGHRI